MASASGDFAGIRPLPGGIAGASLKHGEGQNVAVVRRDALPGGIAGASLKHPLLRFVQLPAPDLSPAESPGPH